MSYLTDTEAATAWTRHRGLTLTELADMTIADLAHHLVDRDPDNRPDPIPQWVLIAIHHQENQP